MTWLLCLALSLGALGLWLLVRSGVARRHSGLPQGRVTYVDTGAWKRWERPLFSERYRLTGRPDYVVHTQSGQIPVEVKSGRAPRQPYPGHLLQLAAYCLLLEEAEGKLPPYGILKYDDRAFEVDYTADLRSALLNLLGDMRRDLSMRDVDRSHDDPARCKGCGYRNQCGQQLTWH